MAFIPTPGAVRVDIQFLKQGQQVHNVIWVSRDAEWTEAQRTALATAISDWWSASGKAGASTHCALTQITVVNQDTESSPSSTLVVNPPVAGTGGADSTANNVTCCATLRTALRGRSYRGRLYWPDVDVSKLLSTTEFTLAYITQIITILGALKDAITALGAIWVVVSKAHNKVARTTGVKTPISAITVDSLIDSQRRRLGGRGV